MKMLRNILAVVLILCLMVGLVPMAAFADVMDVEQNAGDVGSAVSEGIENSVEENDSAVSEGIENSVEENDSAVSEGIENTVEENDSAVSEGIENTVEENDSAVSEGIENTIEEDDGAVSEEIENSAEEDNSRVAKVPANEDVAASRNTAVGVENVSFRSRGDIKKVGNNEADNASPTVDTSVSGMPQAPEAFTASVPVAPVAPIEPDLTGLSDEDANERIRLYNKEVERYNEAVEQYNTEYDAYEAAVAEYNASIESFNNCAASYNALADEHNKAEQEKLDAYHAAMEEYNKKAITYTEYQKKIDAVSDKNLAKVDAQMESLGDIGRLDKESILTLGTVLEEDYTVKYGWRSSTLGHSGDLVISWDALIPGKNHSTIQIQAGEESEDTYKVANLHIFEDFKDFNEMNDYQSELGWDCMNINVDDANGVIIIPKALIDRIAMIEIEVAEVGKNDTVTVVGQNSIFTSNYVTTVGRFFEGYTDGPYWLSAGTIFQSTAIDSESDWTGTGHTFSYSQGTTDCAEIKNPLNVNHYVFQRYGNPYTLPEKPEEVTANMMDKAEALSFIEGLGAKLSSLLGLPEREIKTNENPTPVVPVIPAVVEIPEEVTPLAEPEQTDDEPTVISAPVDPIIPEEVKIPDEVTPTAEHEQTADEPALIPAPVAPVVPAVDEIPDEVTPLAEPEQTDDKPAEIPTLMNVVTEKVDGQLSTLVHNEFEEEIADDETPMASGASWALVNLIASLLTVLLALVSLVSRREKEDESNEKETRVRLSVVIPAAASVILFILTENMNNPMAMVDIWTPVMLLILVGGCMLALFVARRDRKEKSKI